ncbi:MAG: PASTA domain-containing protein [Promicromonosporaceae bacterium]|nr:PASTA domain-containing protein [Promicromonosporaceae bacterium]
MSPAPAGTQVMAPAGAPTQPWGPVSAPPAAVVPPPVAQPQFEEEPRRRGLLATLITLAVVLVGGIIAIVMLTGGGDSDLVEVPLVPLGSTEDEARDIIEGANFEFRWELDEAGEGAPDTAVRQDPEGGAQAESGSLVTVFFAPQPGPGEVPDLTRMSQENAAAMLASLGLEVGDVRTEPSIDIPENLIIRTDPPAGTVVEPGTAITLYVSDGTLELPDLIGLTEDEARDVLDGLGLQWNVRSEATADFPVGTVMRQSPEPGAVAQAQRVVITIAEAPPIVRVPVPALVGRTWNDALALCAQVNVNCQRGQDEESTEWPAGVVIRIEPGAGTLVDEGATVTVIVSAGPGPAPDPEPCPWPGLGNLTADDPACLEPTDPGDGG